MSEILVTPLKWVEYLRFRNGSFRGTIQTQPAASPQVRFEPKAAGSKSQPSLMQHSDRLGYLPQCSRKSGRSFWMQQNL
ncbi:MAG: hypothetical protein ABJH20_06070 [Rhizobiaceae bacterium]